VTALFQGIHDPATFWSAHINAQTVWRKVFEETINTSAVNCRIKVVCDSLEITVNERNFCHKKTPNGLRYLPLMIVKTVASSITFNKTDTASNRRKAVRWTLCSAATFVV
jgi:hypothetical protein